MAIEPRYSQDMEEQDPTPTPGWLDFELPLHMEFELQNSLNLLNTLEEDQLMEVTQAALTHNFKLVNIARQSLERVAMLEELIESADSGRA